MQIKPEVMFQLCMTDSSRNYIEAAIAKRGVTKKGKYAPHCSFLSVETSDLDNKNILGDIGKVIPLEEEITAKVIGVRGLQQRGGGTVTVLVLESPTILDFRTVTKAKYKVKTDVRKNSYVPHITVIYGGMFKRFESLIRKTVVFNAYTIIHRNVKVLPATSKNKKRAPVNRNEATNAMWILIRIQKRRKVRLLVK
eukprot:TRINITY_DN7868_c0_g1_i1.p1 TRINITY_DN7868_c0_g1~~TRINITY_DN7868_c0_g1_i1.p1  ORF type:complete len:196 (-),score=23.58 TRINITY_DN7868_c0_g1_i1:105-692(-)